MRWALDFLNGCNALISPLKSVIRFCIVVSMQFIWFFIFLVVVLILYVALRIFAQSKRARPQTYTAERPSSPYRQLEFSPPAPFNRLRIHVDAQASSWRQKAEECGDALARAQVRAIFLSHGTFVGDDPFGMVGVLQSLGAPGLGLVRRFTKKLLHQIAGDNGNFTPEYVQLLEDSLKHRIPCRDFTWSSENHHAARLRGAVLLAHRLAQESNERRVLSGDRFLLIGHSHAGQVFALLTRLLGHDRKLNNIARELMPHLNVDETLNTIRTLNLDFVTLGTPPFYGWDLGPHHRLLNIVNHRGSDFRGGNVTGILKTRDGDYVQQYAIAGSDLPAAASADRAYNKMLDDILGKGSDAMIWANAIRQRMRVPQYGITILIDYKDSKRTGINFVNTVFGHGIYTRYEVMLFNLQTIVQALY